MPGVYVCPNAAWACYLPGKWTKKTKWKEAQ